MSINKFVDTTNLRPKFNHGDALHSKEDGAGLTLTNLRPKFNHGDALHSMEDGAGLTRTQLPSLPQLGRLHRKKERNAERHMRRQAGPAMTCAIGRLRASAFIIFRYQAICFPAFQLLQLGVIVVSLMDFDIDTT